MNGQIQAVISKAQKECQQAGFKLTTKRQNILLLMLDGDQPESAYELADRYKQTYQDNVSPMSVYRMLNVLIEAGLVHKLESNNHYILCSHITCRHEHQQAQFLICDRCHKAQEIGINPELSEQLKISVAETGFEMQHLQLELHGICQECRESGE